MIPLVAIFCDAEIEQQEDGSASLQMDQTETVERRTVGDVRTYMATKYPNQVVFDVRNEGGVSVMSIDGDTDDSQVFPPDAVDIQLPG